MPYVITKNNFEGTIDVPNLTQNRNFNLPNASGNLVVDSQLSAVALSGSYNDLKNKPTISATPKAYVTATGKSGTSWYRTWSDGFKEIGFIYSANMLNGNEQTVTLPWSMPSNNYHISYTPLTDSSGNGNFVEQTFYRKSQTTTRFVFQQAWLAKTGINFYVCGY